MRKGRPSSYGQNGQLVQSWGSFYGQNDQLVLSWGSSYGQNGQLVQSWGLVHSKNLAPCEREGMTALIPVELLRFLWRFAGESYASWSSTRMLKKAAAAAAAAGIRSSTLVLLRHQIFPPFPPLVASLDFLVFPLRISAGFHACFSSLLVLSPSSSLGDNVLVPTTCMRNVELRKV
jgi:hypothetical protein